MSPRVQFDFDEELVKFLDELRHDTRARTRREIIVEAITVYGWIIGKTMQGYTIVAEKEEEVTKEVVMSGIESVRRRVGKET